MSNYPVQTNVDTTSFIKILLDQCSSENSENTAPIDICCCRKPHLYCPCKPERDSKCFCKCCDNFCHYLTCTFTTEYNDCRSCTISSYRKDLKDLDKFVSLFGYFLNYSDINNLTINEFIIKLTEFHNKINELNNYFVENPRSCNYHDFLKFADEIKLSVAKEKKIFDEENKIHIEDSTDDLEMKKIKLREKFIGLLLIENKIIDETKNKENDQPLNKNNASDKINYYQIKQRKFTTRWLVSDEIITKFERYIRNDTNFQTLKNTMFDFTYNNKHLYTEEDSKILCYFVENGIIKKIWKGKLVQPIEEKYCVNFNDDEIKCFKNGGRMESKIDNFGPQQIYFDLSTSSIIKALKNIKPYMNPKQKELTLFYNSTFHISQLLEALDKSLTKNTMVKNKIRDLRKCASIIVMMIALLVLIVVPVLVFKWLYL